MSKLPADTRPIKMDPDLARALEQLLEPYEGKQLEKAQAALLKHRQTGIAGSFASIVGSYRDAVEAAVGR